MAISFDWTQASLESILAVGIIQQGYFKLGRGSSTCLIQFLLELNSRFCVPALDLSDGLRVLNQT